MKNFEIILTKKYRFVVTAESIEEATAWAQTHDFEDVEAETSAYDVDFSEEILGETEEEAAFTI
jgi:hypothetical protein